MFFSTFANSAEKMSLEVKPRKFIYISEHCCSDDYHSFSHVNRIVKGLSQLPVNGWVSPSIGGLPDDVSSMLGVGGHGKMAGSWVLEYTPPSTCMLRSTYATPPKKKCNSINENVSQKSLSSFSAVGQQWSTEHGRWPFLTRPWRSLGA